ERAPGEVRDAAYAGQARSGTHARRHLALPAARRAAQDRGAYHGRARLRAARRGDRARAGPALRAGRRRAPDRLERHGQDRRAARAQARRGAGIHLLGGPRPLALDGLRHRRPAQGGRGRGHRCGARAPRHRRRRPGGPARLRWLPTADDTAPRGARRRYRDRRGGPAGSRNRRGGPNFCRRCPGRPGPPRPATRPGGCRLGLQGTAKLAEAPRAARHPPRGARRRGAGPAGGRASRRGRTRPGRSRDGKTAPGGHREPAPEGALRVGGRRRAPGGGGGDLALRRDTRRALDARRLAQGSGPTPARPGVPGREEM
ncbi:MAG: hypothetical protein PA3071, partial [uncultured Rubrobacteraceae bacterium]